MQDLLETTAARARAYLAAIHERNVAPTDEALANLAQFDEPFGEAPVDPADVIAMLDDYGSPATVANAGGRFFGFVNGGALPASVAANWLAAAWDQNAAMSVSSPLAARLEEIVSGWLVDALGLPDGTGVGLRHRGDDG